MLTRSSIYSSVCLSVCASIYLCMITATFSPWLFCTYFSTSTLPNCATSKTSSGGKYSNEYWYHYLTSYSFNVFFFCLLLLKLSSCPPLRKVTQIELPSPPSHLALPVVCRQPQQKSGRKQPETNTSLPLQGMLCFLKEGKGKPGFKGTQKHSNVSEIIQKKRKQSDLLFSQKESFLYIMI